MNSEVRSARTEGLKDGDEGILLRKDELDALEAERQREIKAFHDSLELSESDDPRPGLQRLLEDLNK
jgi:DNA invertase Pin-like site-specific DNA recombinase